MIGAIGKREVGHPKRIEAGHEVKVPLFGFYHDSLRLFPDPG
jgi:hypothetical protein